MIDLQWLQIATLALSVVLYAIVLQFFRNPKRTVTLNPDAIICPADGKVVTIEEVFEDEILKDKRIQVSIFMSPFNVHVNRYPLGGKVAEAIHHEGKFLVAWHPKSSTLNERTTVTIDNDRWGKILFRQIAGAVARRIVMYSKPGDLALQGSEYGFIKFGSRVDLFLPLDSERFWQFDEKSIDGMGCLLYGDYFLLFSTLVFWFAVVRIIHMSRR